MPDSFYTCASGGLGHGLPAAVGVALARPGCKVISILGDGSAMYAIQGLWSAAELALPVAFVIINNGGYRALDEFAAHFGLGTPPGTRLAHLDFCALARAQGIEALRVSSVRRARCGAAPWRSPPRSRSCSRCASPTSRGRERGARRRPQS